MSGTEPSKKSHASVFSRLRLGGKRQIPFIAQLTPTDCGAASLSMALAYHGKELQIHAVRGVLGGGRNGVTAKQILMAARSYGFRARGVGVDLETLQYLTPGSILHWELTHFVVFDRWDKKYLYIVDPAVGRRRIPAEEASKSLSGVAILLEPSETFSAEKVERKGRYKRYLDWMMGVRGIWSRVLTVSIFLQLLALAVPSLMGAIVDKVVPRADFQLLYLVGAGCISMASFEFLSQFLRSRLLLHLRTQIETRMSLDFVEHLLALPYAFFQQRSTGDLMMRLSSQAAIRELLTTGALSALLDGALVLVYFCLLLGAAPWLALVAAVLAVLQVTIVLVASRRSADLMTEGLAVQAKLESYQVEMLAGIETLKSMGAGPRATARWTDLYVDVLNSSLARGQLEGTFQSLIGTLRFLGPIALLLTGAYQVLDGTLSLGIMLGLSALGSGFLEPVANLVGTAMKLTQVKSYMARLEDVLDAPIEPTRPNTQTAGRPLNGRIDVRQLSFRYPSEQAPTLEDISFEIGPGECVAIVGASGSGKSTLARLLAGLYTPATGSISFDGADMATLDLAHLRERLGIVTQDTRLFSGTLRDNVTLFEPTVPNDAVQAACELACLHPDIARMPMGYDTMLADGGTSLSGGQRQRLSLARALLRRPDILILDEATSALDTVTEQRVQAHLRELACTRVLVAHRLSTIIESDKIIVLEQGRLVAVGRHADLLLRCPPYQALIRAQHSPQESAFQPEPAVAALRPAPAAPLVTPPPRPVQPPLSDRPLPASVRPAPAATWSAQPPAYPAQPAPASAWAAPPVHPQATAPSTYRPSMATLIGPPSSPSQRPGSATLIGPPSGPSQRPISSPPPALTPTHSPSGHPLPLTPEGLRARLSAMGGLDRTEPLELSRRKSGSNGE
ncbi:MAG: Lipid export ATP-binding/permease protein MsbA [Myxococcaceae bacterium]|nr:Lipid export ATP-binding/permease protein MsbA [Myxococcaceae bacterium]